MESKDWQRVEALFTEALDQPTGERRAFVAERCGDDDGLRGRPLPGGAPDRRRRHGDRVPGRARGR